MRLKYVGDQEGLDIPALGLVVARGEPVEMTGDMAEEFLKRDDWVRVDKPKTKDGEA